MAMIKVYPFEPRNGGDVLFNECEFAVLQANKMVRLTAGVTHFSPGVTWSTARPFLERNATYCPVCQRSHRPRYTKRAEAAARATNS